MLTVRDLMNRFGVGERTVLLWVASGQIKAVNVARNPAARRPSWRFREEDVLAWENGRRTGPAPAPPTRRWKHSADVIEFIK
jgi:transposase